MTAATWVVMTSVATNATGTGKAGALHDQPKAVSAEAEEHVVPERHQAGIAHQQVQRSREWSIRRAAYGEIEQRLAADVNVGRIASAAKAASATGTSR